MRYSTRIASRSRRDFVDGQAQDAGDQVVGCRGAGHKGSDQLIDYSTYPRFPSGVGLSLHPTFTGRDVGR